MADLDQPYRNANVEDLVLPDETIIGDRIADIRCNLGCFLDRTSHQERAEFVAAQPPDKVGIADLVLDQRRDLAEHVVTREMAAAVIDRLEAVEVHVEQHVDRFLRVGRVHRLVEPAFEFAAVDQSRQCIVCRLVAHLAREPADLTDIVEHDNGTRNAVTGTANRRRR